MEEDLFWLMVSEVRVHGHLTVASGPKHSEAEHRGGQCMVEQSSSPHSEQEAGEQERKSPEARSMLQRHAY
jgi:hypothetical protein